MNSFQLSAGELTLQVSGIIESFDIIPVANSLLRVIGDLKQARIVQQLHYLLFQEYGAVIEGQRWIYRTIQDWQQEVLPTSSFWQTRSALEKLESREIIFREKLQQAHHRNYPYWRPNNQIYYYRLNYQKLDELALEYAQKWDLRSTTKLRDEAVANTKFCGEPQNNTKNTSLENEAKKHTTKKCETNKKNFSIDKDSVVENQSNKKSVTTKVVKEVKTPPDVETKVNKKPMITPWKDREELQEFHRQLVNALPQIANIHNPEAVARLIIDGLKMGNCSSYWEDFKAGLPIGTATKPDWEYRPGEVYPNFFYYLVEKLREGNNTTTAEQHHLKAMEILNKPKMAKALWQQFKNSVVRVKENAERDLQLGINYPALPVWTKERPLISDREAMVAGEAIAQFASSLVDGTDPRLLLEGEIAPKAPTNFSVKEALRRGLQNKLDS